ncbi:MAG: TauD/TfdA family dioxygenase [Gammaproteobacteria bacterium]|nr:TauD/TfdA family dioxygenase [Gammaproteobacteria bacterium]
MDIQPLSTHIAAEVTQVDLRGALDPNLFAAISDAFDQYAVLVFRNQQLDDAAQIAFSRRFGELEIMQKGALGSATVLAGISNVDPATDRVLARDDPRMMRQFSNQLWHTDSSFKAISAKASLLHAREVPATGGATHFASMRAAWDTLDSETQNLCLNLAAEHNFVYSRSLTIADDFLTEDQKAEVPPVPQALVNQHPRTKRRALYLASHASHILGWPFEQGRRLLDTLTEHATQAEFVYTHEWRQWDLVMWDNRATMHKGSRYDYTTDRRVMIRTTVAGDSPTISPQQVERAIASAQRSNEGEITYAN